jgi:D-alanine-D-alanine ligase-like ATP-grasp enzyme
MLFRAMKKADLKWTVNQIAKLEKQVICENNVTIRKELEAKLIEMKQLYMRMVGCNTIPQPKENQDV